MALWNLSCHQHIHLEVNILGYNLGDIFQPLEIPAL